MKKKAHEFADIKAYLETLELDSDVSPEEVALAYRDLVNVWHPDRFTEIPHLKKRAEEKLKKINEAYEKIQIHLSSGQRQGESKSGDEGRIRTGPHPGVSITRDRMSEKAPARKHPWVRSMARGIDYLWFVLFLGSINTYGILLGLNVPTPLFPIVSTFMWVFLEAAFLSALGTTPGKWLLRITLTDANLQKPGYLSSLKRSLSVWCNGIGTGIFFVAPVTMVIAFRRLRKEGYAPWDREGRFYLIHRKIAASRFFLAFLFLATFSLLNTYEIRKQMRPVSKNDQAFDEQEGFAHEERSRTLDKETPKGPRETAFYLAEDYYSHGKRCVELGRYEEAIRVYREVIRLRPDYAEAQYDLGVSLAKLGRHKEAAEALNQAIRLRPGYAKAHHILGLAYLATGKKRAAIEQQEILRKLDKALADELLAYIESMHRFIKD